MLSPSFDPRDGERSFQRKLDGRPPTAIAAGALQLKPGTPVPVLLEHDRSRPLGYVRSLFLLPWADGLTWHAAILELNDDGWPRNQGVSIGSIPLRGPLRQLGDKGGDRRLPRAEEAATRPRRGRTMSKKPPAKPTAEQPTSTKHSTVRFSLGSLTKAKGGQVVHTGKLWSKEVH
jgi:hypothetical protein